MELERAERLEQGKRLLTRNAFTEAEMVFESCCLKSPEDAEAWFSLGVTRHRQKKHEAALLAFERALHFDYGNIATHNARANMLAALGRERDALEELELTLKLDPNNVKTLTNQGIILYRQNELDEALSALDRSLAIQSDQADALHYRASLLLRVDRAEDALADAELLGRHQQTADVWCLQASALLVLGRYEQAQQTALRAQQADSESIPVIVMCALAQAAMGEFDHAEMLFSFAEIKDAAKLGELLAEHSLTLPRAMQSNPLQLYLSLAKRRLDECNWSHISAFRQCLDQYLNTVDQIDGSDADLSLLEAVCFTHTSPLLRLELSKFIALATRKQIKPFTHHTHVEPERLRVAYLAHSFDGEAMTRFTAGIFALHNRSRFEIICYSLNPGDQSRLNARIKQHCDHYVELFPLSPALAAAKIREDDIQILIDLTEMGNEHPYQLLQHRPAPVQVSFGDAFSSGCHSLQYRITDVVAMDCDRESNWVEKLITLPDSHCLYDQTQTFAQDQLSRSDLNLPNESLVLCAFAPAKLIQPEIFGCWMQIMREIPSSVLWLIEWNDGCRQNLQNEAYEYGVNPRRLIFAAPEHDAQAHVSRLQAADLFLDTEIANSLMTRDALWAGVPVITIAGKTMAQRLTASQLEALDFASMICETRNDYVQRACRLLSQPAFLQITRRKLQRHVINKPLFHTQQTVLNLEAAYEQIWQQFQKGLPPQAMVIDPE